MIEVESHVPPEYPYSYEGEDLFVEGEAHELDQDPFLTINSLRMMMGVPPKCDSRPRIVLEMVDDWLSDQDKYHEVILRRMPVAVEDVLASGADKPIASLGEALVAHLSGERARYQESIDRCWKLSRPAAYRGMSESQRRCG